MESIPVTADKVRDKVSDKGLAMIPESIPRSPGHYQEWMDASK